MKFHRSPFFLSSSPSNSTNTNPASESRLPSVLIHRLRFKRTSLPSFCINTLFLLVMKSQLRALIRQQCHQEKSYLISNASQGRHVRPLHKEKWHKPDAASFFNLPTVTLSNLVKLYENAKKTETSGDMGDASPKAWIFVRGCIWKWHWWLA